MWGQHIETLNVYAQRQGSNGKPVWTRNGNQGNAWKQAEVAIDATSDFKVSEDSVDLRCQCSKKTEITPDIYNFLAACI